MADLNNTLVKSLIEQACWRNIGVWSQQKTRCEKLEAVVHCRNCEVFAEAAKTVFRRESTEAELFERSLDLYHGSDFKQHLGEVSVLPFRVDDTWLCVYPSQIVTIAKKANVHRIPHRGEEFIRGLIAVDGAIYTCVRMSSLLGIKDKCEQKKQHVTLLPGVFGRIIIVQTPKKRLAIEVDEVRSVTHFAENEFKTVSEKCEQSLKPHVTKELCFDQHLNESLFLLDVDSIEQLFYKAIL